MTHRTVTHDGVPYKQLPELYAQSCQGCVAWKDYDGSESRYARCDSVCHALQDADPENEDSLCPHGIWVADTPEDLARYISLKLQGTTHAA